MRKVMIDHDKPLDFGFVPCFFPSFSDKLTCFKSTNKSQSCLLHTLALSVRDSMTAAKSEGLSRFPDWNEICSISENTWGERQTPKHPNVQNRIRTVWADIALASHKFIISFSGVPTFLGIVSPAFRMFSKPGQSSIVLKTTCFWVKIHMVRVSLFKLLAPCLLAIRCHIV